MHLIIAGDSNVFGEGCHDKETISTKLSQIMPNYYVYNFGRRGGGPHNLLSLMEHFPSYKKMIQNKKGIMIYNFYPVVNTERVIGAKNYLQWDQGKSAYYTLDSLGNLQFNGTFNNRFFITAFYNFINRFHVLDKLIPNLPRITDNHMKLVAAVIKKMQKVYLHDFPEGRFIAIINDSYGRNENIPEDVLYKYLRESDVETAIIPAYNRTERPLATFLDGHFNNTGNSDQAKKFLAIINAKS